MKRSATISPIGNTKKALRNDDVYVKSKIVPFPALIGMKARAGYEQAIIVSYDKLNPDTDQLENVNELVNVVSNSYGHLPNEKFFANVEAALIGAGIKYKTRSINRNNRSFAVDYILDDERYVITVNNGLNTSPDKIAPQLRFVNTYDGSAKTSGHFGFFRKVCENGLHLFQSDIAFSFKHSGNIVDIVIPHIDTLVERFIDNEYYSLSEKFDVLAERPISDLEAFVKLVADQTKVFKFEISEKNPAPTANARLVIETIEKEAKLLGVAPNHWLGYNAFNEILHTKFDKGFDKARELDGKLFETILALN